MQTCMVYLAIYRRFITPCNSKSEKVKRSTTITELVVVWNLCSVCTCVTKSKAVILYQHFMLFAIAIARSRKISELYYYWIRKFSVLFFHSGHSHAFSSHSSLPECEGLVLRSLDVLASAGIPLPLSSFGWHLISTDHSIMSKNRILWLCYVAVMANIDVKLKDRCAIDITVTE